MKSTCSFFRTFGNGCRIAVFVIGLALACAPLAHAGGVVSICDGTPAAETNLRTTLAGGGKVTFTCSGTIILSSTITISSPNETTIDGTGQNVIISGGNALTVFFVPTGVKLNLNKLTIANGSADSGGGIYNEGMLTVTNSTLSSNSAQNDGGGIEDDHRTLTVRNCKFISNTGAYGGGIENLNGTANVSNTTFSGNSAQNDGGGIENDRGTLEVDDDTFSDNIGSEAGGIENDGGTLTVTNSTFSGNKGVDSGGGIENYFGTLTVINSTISGNSSFEGGGITDRASMNPSTSTLVNTIVANNPDFRCVLYFGGQTYVGGLMGGGNLDASGTRVGTASLDPMLGPLQYNGGHTQTMALGANSPAIGNAVEANCPIRDQRGFPRPFTSNCSIGAYEPGTLFRSFLAYAAVNLTNPASPSFAVIGTFTLRADNDGVINPLADLVQFRLGALFSTTISPNSFQLTNGSFVYVQSVNGSPVFSMAIRPLDGNSYAFVASSGQPWNLTRPVDPIVVQLTIGDDGGTTRTGEQEQDDHNPLAPAPTLTSIAPTLGARGTAVPVTLTGTNLTDTTAVNVSGTGVTVGAFTVTATTLTTTFTITGTATPLGARTVSVTTPGGTSNTVSFTVIAAPTPTLTSISPASGARGTLLLPVTLTGTNLTGATAVTVSGTGIIVSGLTVVNPTTIRANFAITATAALTARAVSVTTPGGTSNTVTFTVVQVSGTLSFTSATNGTLGTVLGVQTLTFTIPTPRAPVTSVITVTNTGAAPLRITEEVLTINIGGLYSVTGTTCSFTTPMAVGGTCTISVRYATPATQPPLPNVGALSVINIGTTPNGILALIAR